MRIFQTVEISVAISDSFAEDVRRKFAFENDGVSISRVPVGVRSAALVVRGLVGRGVLERGGGLKPGYGLGLVSGEYRIPAMRSRSAPTRCWSARTVVRCSGGYSRSRKRVAECAAMYVSRCGIINVARSSGLEKGLSWVWLVRGCEVKACMALAMRYLWYLVSNLIRRRIACLLKMYVLTSCPVFRSA